MVPPWAYLPPPEWAVFVACTLRAFPALSLETVLDGVRRVLPFEGHAELFEAARRGAIAHAVGAARASGEEVREEDVAFWSEHLLMSEARGIAAYCFHRAAGLE